MRSFAAVRPAAAAAATILVCAAPVAAVGQERFRYERAGALSGPCCGDSGDDVAVLPDGSFIVVGHYGALDLDGDGRIDQRSEGGRDPIIMKGRPGGDLAWVRAPRSPAASYLPLSVALDRQGGAYMVGAFGESMQFRSGERIVSRGASDGLLARYSGDGDPLWARAIGGERHDSLWAAASDAAGNVYVTGTVQAGVDVDSDGRVDATVTAANGLLVASYDLTGTLRWAKVAASSRDIAGVAIAVTPEGEVHVGGHYSGADVDLDRDGTVDLPAPGAASVPFIARFDAAGRLTRASGLLGSGNTRVGQLTAAANGELLASGYTQGTVDLNGDGTADVTATPGASTPFVVRFGRDGALRWVRAFLQKERVAIQTLATSADRIAVGGLYQGRLDLDLDGRPDAAADPDGRSEGFVAMLDHGGAIQQVLAITGPGADQVRAATFSPDGRGLEVTGFLRLTADFDGDGVPEGGIRCDNYGDIFWSRYRLRP